MRGRLKGEIKRERKSGEGERKNINKRYQALPSLRGEMKRERKKRELEGNQSQLGQTLTKPNLETGRE